MESYSTGAYNATAHCHSQQHAKCCSKPDEPFGRYLERGWLLAAAVVVAVTTKAVESGEKASWTVPTHGAKVCVESPVCWGGCEFAYYFEGNGVDLGIIELGAPPQSDSLCFPDRYPSPLLNSHLGRY